MLYLIMPNIVCTIGQVQGLTINSTLFLTSQVHINTCTVSMLCQRTRYVKPIGTKETKSLKSEWHLYRFQWWVMNLPFNGVYGWRRMTTPAVLPKPASPYNEGCPPRTFHFYVFSGTYRKNMREVKIVKTYVVTIVELVPMTNLYCHTL